VYIALIASTSASGKIFKKWSCRHALVTAREHLSKHDESNGPGNHERRLMSC